MRILWMSNSPAVNTGYGTQTRLFAPRLRDLGHDVEIVAFYGHEGHVHDWDGIRVWPKGYASYGADIAGEVIRRTKPDVFITLIDAWPLAGHEFAAATHWAPWFPSDSDPMAKAVVDQVRLAQSPLVFTEHSMRQCQELGLDRALFVPHGFDPDVYHPLERSDALDYRREKMGVPEDAFLIGIVAANKGRPARKSWHEQLAAAAEIQRRHDDVWLYVHTHLGPQMQGVPIETLADSFGIDKSRLKACDQFLNMIGGYSDVEMRWIFNSIDLLSNVAMGEGFGLPILEAQACGTRVLVGDWTAMTEVANVEDGCNLFVDVSEADPYAIETGAIQYQPHVYAVASRMEAAYQTRDADLSASIVEGVGRYRVQNVMDNHWQPALATIQERIEARPGITREPIAPHEGVPS